jgi:hypothetical protein
LEDAAGGRVEGLVGAEDPFLAVTAALEAALYDEIIVSTLPKRFSRWLRQDLITQIERLGLPVTVITPRKQQPTSDDNMHDVARIGGGGMLSG